MNHPSVPPPPQHGGGPQYPWAGQPVGYGPPPQHLYPSVYPPPAPRKSTTGRVALIVLAVVVAVGGLAYVISQRSDPKSERLAIYEKLGSPEGFTRDPVEASDWSVSGRYTVQCAEACAVDPAVSVTTWLTNNGVTGVKLDEVKSMCFRRGGSCPAYAWDDGEYRLVAKLTAVPTADDTTTYTVSLSIGAP